MKRTSTPLADQLNRIEEAETFSQLCKIKQELEKSVFPDGEDGPAIAEAVDCLHEYANRQGVSIAIQQCKRLGIGVPPVPFAFLLFGSGGRRERALVSDQDNGLVYRLPSSFSSREQREIEGYFQLFASILVNGLAEAGYPLCEGNVMCSNPRWRGPLELWKRTCDSWYSDPTWENVRYLLLVSDARLIAGDTSLFEQLQTHYWDHLNQSPALLSRMVSNTLHHRVPIGWFGRLLTEVRGPYRGAINVKTGLYLPFVNCIRLWSLAAGSRETESLKRLKAIAEAGLWPQPLCADVQESFQQIRHLRLLASRHWPDDAYKSSGFLPMGILPSGQIAGVKRIAKLALRLQAMTSQRFLKEGENG